jgi:hypothetical protein
MNWHDIVLWYGPAFAWIVLWTQFVTLRFYDKNESLFKDFINSGALDLALSSIDAQKLVPALARLCDAVAEAKALKTPEELNLLVTEDILGEVDFLPHLAGAESALREEKTMQDFLERLQQQAAALWKLGLLHSLAVVFLPAGLLIPPLILRRATAGLLALVISVTFILIVMGVVRYQQMRDKLIHGLSVNRKAL